MGFADEAHERWKIENAAKRAAGIFEPPDFRYLLSCSGQVFASCVTLDEAKDTALEASLYRDGWPVDIEEWSDEADTWVRIETVQPKPNQRGRNT